MMRAFFSPSALLVAFLAIGPIFSHQPRGSNLEETIRLLEIHLNQLKNELKAQKQRAQAAPPPVHQENDGDEEGQEDALYSGHEAAQNSAALETNAYSGPMIGEVPPGWAVGTIPESAIPQHPTGRLKKTNKNPEKDGISAKARALIKKGNFTAARSELLALSKDEKYQDKASVFYWLGLIDLYQRKKPDQAAACFAKAYHHCEKSGDKKDDLLRIWVLLRLTETLLAKNNTQEAKIVFAQCEQSCERLKTPMTKKLAASIKRTKARMIKCDTQDAHTPDQVGTDGEDGTARTPPAASIKRTKARMIKCDTQDALIPDQAGADGEDGTARTPPDPSPSEA